MSKTQDKINFLYDVLHKNNLIKEIYEIKGYVDEPSINSFTIKLNNRSVYSDEETWLGNSSGFSFDSKEAALIKCLAEGVERLSNTTYKKSEFIKSSFSELGEAGIDPFLFTNDPTHREIPFFWMRGFDLFTKDPVLVPAQTIFFNYQLDREPQLSELISTGAAAAFNQEQAVLHGLYEIIERDAFMLTYYLKRKVPKIRTDLLKDKKLLNIKESLERYELEWHLFDITTDLGIPTMMSIIVDRTGFGPAVSIGLKTLFNIETAIAGSAQEALHSRFFIKSELIKSDFIVPPIKSQNIHSLSERGLFWVKQGMIPNLNFLLNIKPKPFNYPKREMSIDEQLELVIKSLKNKKKKVYVVDITHTLFRETGFVVVKIVSPDIQPLYLNENKKRINPERVGDITSFFGIKNFSYNLVPHPFL